jgi:hypothetical protein
VTVDVRTLPARSAASLRAFVGAQHLGVERRPDSVAPVQPSDHDYRRLLVRRVPLEGRCVHYQTYDASGDENDWNINIAPDPAHRWLLDPSILFALSLASGAPSPIDLSEIKSYDGVQAIECELTPDDALYDTFETAGLPITSGGWWPDQDEQQGLGPQNSWVGVYGVFAGDYGHGGRPEIHPFDAFWRRFHHGRSSSIGWDLGVFQDDSNRFNSDWSRAPIDVEFRVPFCLDVPVTLRAPVTHRARFTLRRSALCSVVGKNTQGAGIAEVTETFTAPTVLFSPRLRNRLEVSVQDLTGLPGHPFALSFTDLTYTTTRRLGILLDRAWLAGAIVIRVAVGQDGFAYWNVSGPNSQTAADAPSSGSVFATPDEVVAQLVSARAARARPVRLRVAEARPVVSASEGSGLAAELVIDQPGEGGLADRRVVTVRPGEESVLVDEASGQTIELDSFDLFASASVGPTGEPARRIEADITGAIARIAGLDRLGHRLRPSTASVEVDESVIVELATRYAPFRDGKVAGEERTPLSESMTRAHPGSADVRADVRITGENGTVRRRVTNEGVDAADGAPAVRVEPRDRGRRLIVGPFGGAPTAVQVDATLVDRFGRRATTRAVAHNFRVVDARPWVERAAGISLAELRGRHARLERAARSEPAPESLASAAMVRALVEVLESLDGEGAVPAGRVAGAVRLALRVAELLPAEP